MKRLWLLIALGIFAGFALQADVMPRFATVPTGWVVDRYAPASFSDVGTYEGRADVLGIGISSAGAFNNRPAAYQSTFYDTQGEQYALTGAGAGSSISADLYIPDSWDSSANGDVRTDMWGVMGDGTKVTGYPIIGFTNYGGAPRYRVWDDTNGVWIDLPAPVTYDAWTAFTILFTGSAYVYYIDGAPVFTDNDVDGSTQFNAIIMQAYNFGGDPSISGTDPVDYTAYWSNAVPEPSSVLMLGTVLLALAGGLRRHFR